MDENKLTNLSAERSVLCGIMLENSALEDLNLGINDFYREAHKVIYTAMVDLYNENRPIDIINVFDKLQEQKLDEAVGGLAYLTGLAVHTPTSANIKSHANIIHQCAVKRELLKCAEEARIKITETDEPMESILDALQNQVMNLSAERHKEKEAVSIGEIFSQNLADLHEASTKSLAGLATGFYDFDKMTGGLRKSDLIVLAARPAMGKTAFALNIAHNVASAGKKVLVVSLEMSAEQLGNRILSSVAGVEGSKLRRPREITQDEWKSLHWASQKHSRASLFITDTPNVTPMSIRRIAKQIKHQQQGLDLIIIDYLQLMASDKRADGRTQEVSAISRALKLLARELDVPVIALSQLSRSVETRAIKKPMLSDLRESGAIEQDADLVMFLYRDTYYNPDSEDTHTELNVAKHRHGPVGAVNLYFDEQYTTFRNLSKERGLDRDYPRY